MIKGRLLLHNFQDLFNITLYNYLDDSDLESIAVSAFVNSERAILSTLTSCQGQPLQKWLLVATTSCCTSSHRTHFSSWKNATAECFKD